MERGKWREGRGQREVWGEGDMWKKGRGSEEDKRRNGGRELCGGMEDSKGIDLGGRAVGKVSEDKMRKLNGGREEGNMREDEMRDLADLLNVPDFTQP